MEKIIERKIGHCEVCGKEISKRRRYCDECRKIKEKETMTKCLNKPGVKEKRRIYMLNYIRRLDVKERQKSIRHCKVCGKEILERRQYCDECRKIKEKERCLKYYKNNKEKRDIYHYNYIKRRNQNSINHCEVCGKEISKRRRYCDECRKIKEKETMTKYLNKPGVKEKRRMYMLNYMRKQNSNSINHCKVCGKEILKKKQYCDECRKIKEKLRKSISYKKSKIS
jgi:predicted nucleic acid-binding Zn ribbon protein